MDWPYGVFKVKWWSNKGDSIHTEKFCADSPNHAELKAKHFISRCDKVLDVETLEVFD